MIIKIKDPAGVPTLDKLPDGSYVVSIPAPDGSICNCFYDVNVLTHEDSDFVDRNLPMYDQNLDNKELCLEYCSYIEIL